MTQTIIRMYSTPDRAAEVEDALREDGFAPDQIRLVPYPGRRTPGTNRAVPSVESLTQVIAAGNVLKDHARIYAEGVLRGGSLLTVHAPFGTAERAMTIMNSFAPITSGVAETEVRLSPWDEAAPISSALRLPVFLNAPSPFSAFWNVPVLLTRSYSDYLGIPLLLKQIAPLSASLRLPLLVSRFNLSSVLGLPVLIGVRRRRV